MRRIGLLMDHPSPHMVGLVNALADRADCAAQVVYFRPRAPERRWGDPAGRLPYQFAGTTKNPMTFLNVPAVLRAMARIRADVWVVNTCYTAPETWAATAWLNAAGLSWVYMNEPLRHRRWVGTLKQAVGLIGMGREAVARYAALVGTAKPSISVPYYLDLDEFLSLPVPMAP